MFDLEKAIAQWRTDACAHMNEEHLEELEVHLRDAVEHGMNSGFSKEDAFVLAAHRLGESDAIGKELAFEAGLVPAKSGKPVRRLGAWRAFAIAATACLFALIGLEWLDWFKHQSYSATALAEVEPIPFSTELQMFSHQIGQAQHKPIDLETEVEVFRSAKVLGDVVDQLNLGKSWELTQTQAVSRLAENLCVKRVGKSSIGENRIP